MKTAFLLLLLTIPMLAHSQPILPDAGFGNNGTAVSQQVGWSKDANDIILQPDGKIIAVGLEYERNDQFNYQPLVTRFLANGQLDSSFGINGSVHFAFDGKSAAQAVALQPDGKIIIACNESILLETINPPSAQLLSRPFIMRLNPNGTLDPGFAANGIHRLGLLDPYINKELAAIKVLPNGSILAGGTVIGAQVNMMLIRLHADGSYDANFGVSGLAQYTTGNDTAVTLSDMAIQADGKIVMAGTAYNLGPAMPDAMIFALWRANAEGTADGSFGTQGRVLTQVSPGTGFIEDMAKRIALQSDGKICLAGTAGNKLALARYLANGTLDPSFGQDGTAIHAGHPNASGMVLHNGNIYTCGAIVQSDYTIDMSISAFKNDGSPDLAFAVDGMHTLAVYKSNYTHALLVQPDGKLVTGGSFEDNNNEQGLMLNRFRTGTTTGISRVEDNPEAVVLYPNPVSDVLTIACRNTKDLQRAEVDIFNASGQTVYTVTFKGRPLTVPVGHLAAGVYMLRVNTGKNVQALNFIKQ